MSITTLAERILLMTPENGFDCGCGNKNGDCTWCRLHREAEAAGMRRDETPPQWAMRFLGVTSRAQAGIAVRFTLLPEQRRVIAKALDVREPVLTGDAAAIACDILYTMLHPDK